MRFVGFVFRFRVCFFRGFEGFWVFVFGFVGDRGLEKIVAIGDLGELRFLVYCRG